MKEIKFRPLRRIKKTGKIVVASYMQWRKIATADYMQNEFLLSIYDVHKNMNPNEFVYDHKGKQLFWFNHTNPESLRRVTAKDCIESAKKIFGIPEDFFDGEEWKLNDIQGMGFHWDVQGFDCDGIPVFSHYTADYIAKFRKDISDFEPLTVDIVIKWYGWILWNLKNAKLKVTE